MQETKVITVPSEPQAGPSAVWTRRWVGTLHSNLIWLCLVDLLMCAGMTAGAPSLFWSAANFNSMAVQFPGYGILALAMVLPMITGGIDLSIIGLSNLAAIIAAFVMQSLAGPAASGVSVFLVVALAVATALAAGALAGALNAFVISRIGVSPILATLGTGLVFSGLAIAMTNGTAIFGFPQAFTWIGDGQVIGLPAPVVVFALIALALSLTLSRTAFGARAYLLGTNAVAARYAGIDVRKVILRTYVTSALCAVAAGLIISARANSAKADYGAAYLLLAILICVLGGVSPVGGSGRIVGVVLAVVTLQIMSTSLNLLGVSNFAAELVWGAVLIFTMAVSRVERGKQ